MASLAAILFVILFAATSHPCAQVTGANRGKVNSGDNRLNSGEFLGPGDILRSADGKSKLEMGRDCNVVLQSTEKGEIWESKSHKAGNPYCVLILIDGVLTVQRNGVDVWYSNNANAPLASNSTSYLLVLERMIVVYNNENNQPIWFSVNQP